MPLCLENHIPNRFLRKYHFTNRFQRWRRDARKSISHNKSISEKKENRFQMWRREAYRLKKEDVGEAALAEELTGVAGGGIRSSLVA